MSAHFEPGEYRIFQDGKEVGRLVALANPDVEHWFLFQDVSPLEITFGTYTAPSRRNAQPDTGRFGEGTSVEWTFKPMGGPPPRFSPQQYLEELNIPGRPRHISATALDCASVPIDQQSQDPVQSQIWWGEYNLLDAAGNPVGGVIVPPSGLFEQWFFDASGSPPPYLPPGPDRGVMTFRLEYVGSKFTPSSTWTPFCVQCSSPV